MKPKLFVTRELPGNALDKLSEYYELVVWDKFEPPTHDYLVKVVGEYNALITLLSDKIDSVVLSKASKLKIISQYAVGYDNIDVEYATKLGIYVTNTPGVLTEATAELTWALIFSVARRIVEADHFVRWGGWWNSKTAWHPKLMLGVELKGKILGVVGLGRIGSRVAEIGKALGMKVIYYSRSRKKELEEKLGIEYRDLDDLIRKADIITLHTPLTNETKYLINEERLKKMKRTAILINTARGAVVDTKALIKALREGWILGAGLDVFEEEPLDKNHELTSFKNVVLTPHIGSATYKARIEMANLVAENLISFYKGEVPPNLVNKEVVRIRKPGFTA